VGERHDEAGVSIEMTWKTFAGDVSEIYEALLVSRALDDEIHFDVMPASTFLRRHITRGVSRLVGTSGLNGISDLLQLDNYAGQLR
jgi:DNA sulfur modification protein DndE